MRGDLKKKGLPQPAQMYAQASVRMLKQIHTATHPTAKLQKTDNCKTAATAAKEKTSSHRAELLPALDAEAEEEKE